MGGSDKSQFTGSVRGRLYPASSIGWVVFHKVVWQHFWGEVGDFILFWCEISSGFCTPKIIKSGPYSASYSKYQQRDAFLRRGVESCIAPAHNRTRPPSADDECVKGWASPVFLVTHWHSVVALVVRHIACKPSTKWQKRVSWWYGNMPIKKCSTVRSWISSTSSSVIHCMRRSRTKCEWRGFAVLKHLAADSAQTKLTTIS